MAKKNTSKYTLQFNETLLTHKKAIRILESVSSRGKANILADALVYYNEIFNIVDVSPESLMDDELVTSPINKAIITRPANDRRGTIAKSKKESIHDVEVIENVGEYITSGKVKEVEEVAVIKNKLKAAGEAVKEQDKSDNKYANSKIYDIEPDEEDEDTDNIFADSLRNSFNF